MYTIYSLIIIAIASAIFLYIRYNLHKFVNMTYTDYIKAHQDRIEREQQLVAKYSQPRCVHANRFTWTSTTVSKHSVHKIDVIETVIGCVIVAIILIASILIG